MSLCTWCVCVKYTVLPPKTQVNKVSHTFPSAQSNYYLTFRTTLMNRPKTFSTNECV